MNAKRVVCWVVGHRWTYDDGNGDTYPFKGFYNQLKLHAFCRRCGLVNK